MYYTVAIRVCTLFLLVVLSDADPKPKPQFYPLFPGPPAPHFVHHGLGADSAYSGSQPWRRTPQNFSGLPSNIDRNNFMDPLSAPAADDLLKNQIPRQIYGLPPAQTLGGAFPQIYKIDNLIIIANPVQAQAQPCIPQPRPPPPPLQPGQEDGLNTRFGEPSSCTWAIVACCSPGSNNIRYNCFELFNCMGLFVDRDPCTPKVVEAAAKSALDFYRNNNGNSANNTTATNSNRV